MDTLAKLQILGEGAKYDICSTVSGCLGSGICQSFTPDGRCISLLRVLMDNHCVRDCSYCPNRVQRDVPRTRFEPFELARLFMDFYRRNYVAGLFLSSGIRDNPNRTMTEMLTTVEILRTRFQFSGYIHLKLIPGCSPGHIQQALVLAQRVSVNCETPDGASLKNLSSNKNWSEIVGAMETVRALTAASRGRQSTQFIVGAARETDAAILERSLDFYRRYNMLRVYFSAFVPVTDTPLGHLDRTPLLREQRLYQSDFLLRNYGFSLKELPFAGGNLPLDRDPKQVWAESNPDYFPLEINRASRSQLLRVPGIGPVSASRIVRVRRSTTLTTADELKNMGVVLKRAAPYLLVGGRSLAPAQKLFNFRQLSFFGSDNYN